MFDIITFGSATKDIFLRMDKGVVKECDEFITRKGICFPLGSKAKVEDIYFTSGGGGTNTAVTFAKQGLSVAYCGKVGDDSPGEYILKELGYYGVNKELISSTKEKPTNHSVIVDVPENDRTIFVYRGASNLHSLNDTDTNNLKAKWFYIAPSTPSLLSDAIEYAGDNEIKVMVNPSKKCLKNEKTKELLKSVDILIMNMEEASILTGIPYNNRKDILEKISLLYKGIVIVTQGVEGVFAYDRKYFYKTKPFITSAVDRTGAGDSFGSGFLSGFIKNGDIEEGLNLGIANSTSCLQKKGAKHGLLSKDDYYNNVEIVKGSTPLEIIN